MVTLLANLGIRFDDSGSNKPLSFKKAIILPYLKNFKKTIHTKFSSLIKNNIWEYRYVLLGRAVLTSF